MTRFNITLHEGVKFVVDSINKMQGGEIFVPKLSSFRIIDLAKAINPNAKIKVTGINYGEKLHEEMISSNETGEILSYKNKYIILPDMKMMSWNKNHYLKKNMSYHSNMNSSEILRNVDHETHTLTSSYFTAITDLALDFLISLCLISMMIYLNFIETLIIFLLLTTISIFHFYFVKKNYSR